jgi:hypothetical protein
MMALRRLALEGAGALAATRPPARRTPVCRPDGTRAQGAGGEGRARAGAVATAWRRRDTGQLL